MSEAWEAKKLGDVCRLINGRAYKKAELLDSGKYPVLRVGNFFSNRSWYHSDLELDEEKYCDEGDLLYAWSASFGPRIWEGPKVIYHYHIWKCELNESQVNKRFLLHWFDWDTDKIRAEQGTGTTMIHVSKGSMEKRAILLPPLAEQQRIVSILDEAFAAIDRAKEIVQQNLANARELFESYLNRVFTEKGEGWEETTVGQACKILNGYAFKSGDFSSDNPTNSIKITNVGVAEFVEDRSSRLPKIFQKEFAKVSVPSGSLVLALTRTIIADGLKVAVVPKTFGNALLNQRVAALLFDGDEAERDCVFFYLQTSCVSDYVREKANTLMQPNLSIGDLRTMPLVLPTSATQRRRLVSKLNTCRNEQTRLIEACQNKLFALDELKQSILQKAFTGQLAAKSPELEAVG